MYQNIIKCQKIFENYKAYFHRTHRFFNITICIELWREKLSRTKQKKKTMWCETTKRK